MNQMGQLAVASLVAAPLPVGGWAVRAAPGDLVETALNAGSFATLLEAIEAADLADTLKGTGPFTIFAPTDDAFAALPDGKLGSLLEPKNKQELLKVLAYHVVPGTVTSGEIVGRTVSYETLEGSALEIDSAGRATKVEEAALVRPDIMASNGVIHVIDRVIIPDEREVR